VALVEFGAGAPAQPASVTMPVATSPIPSRQVVLWFDHLVI
jgi:hypothetical protein